MIHKVLGCAGAGKTNFLLNTLDIFMEHNVRPEEIGFISYTRRAVGVAVERAVKMFPQYSRKSLVYFKTMHSLAYRVTGASKEQMLTYDVLRTFGDRYGYEFSNSGWQRRKCVVRMSEDDKILSAYLRGKENNASPEEMYQQYGGGYSFTFFADFVAKYEQYKKVNGYIDFSDLLINAKKQGVFPHFKVLILDEAQDFTPIQWKLAEMLSNNSQETYIAGDDLQMIYGYQGANVQDFLAAPADEVILLEQSHRVPRAIQQLAYELAEKNIVHKTDKQLKPKDEEGRWQVINSLWAVDFGKYDTYLILCRNIGPLPEVMFELRRMGVPAIMEGEANYSKSMAKVAKGISEGSADESEFESEDDWLFYNSVKNNGFLQDFEKPRVVVSTIHKAKGDEAKCVVLLTELTRASAQEYITDPDTFHRILYVGLTRASKELYLLEPEKFRSYKYNILPAVKKLLRRPQ